MGFGGGGGGALPAHVHNNVPLQGGPLDFVNDTVSSMNAGSTTFSNGAALQELVIGNATEVLAVNAGATAPEWVVAGAGSWTQVFSDTLGADANAWTNTFTAIPQDDNAMFCLQIQCGFDADSDILLRFHDSSGAITTGYYTDGIRIQSGAADYLDDDNANAALLCRESNGRKGFICTSFITMGNSTYTDTENEVFTWWSSGVNSRFNGGGTGGFATQGGTVNTNPITSFNGITLYANAVAGANVFEIGSKVTLWKIA
jgi:hypothetical protein